LDAIAVRVVKIMAARLAEPALPQPQPPPPLPPLPAPPATAQPVKDAPVKLTYSLKELSEELGLSKASIYRLGARGLLRPLPYLRTKHFTRQEVERFLGGRAK
jgi:hypothetical protein